MPDKQRPLRNPYEVHDEFDTPKSSPYKESKTKTCLRHCFFALFFLCFLGTVVGIPLTAMYANGGKNNEVSPITLPNDLVTPITEVTTPYTTSESLSTRVSRTTASKTVSSTTKVSETTSSTIFSTTTTSKTGITTSIETTTTPSTTTKQEVLETTITTTTTAPVEPTTELATKSTASSTTTKTTTTTVKELPPEGWLEWTEWTECSVTCGTGEVVRSRECVSYTPGNGVNVCDGYDGSDQVEVKKCQPGTCPSGQVMVYEQVDQARTFGVEDNLFLNRYALAVTDNGKKVNTPGVETVGYGVWRLTELQLEELLLSTYNDTYNGISGDLQSNAKLVCNLEIETLDIENVKTLANEDPCFSMIALTTYLALNGHYPLPLDPDAQRRILYKTTDHVVTDWNSCLGIELKVAQEECTQSDIDFDFVIDSSGSVGLRNWWLTMSLIGTNWIKELIVPNGSKTCGNHVAGRWFSTDTKRFHDFEPPSKEVYAPKSYADYVADVFMGIPYQRGSTDTAGALFDVRTKDLPTAREGLKYVMVFTDGLSNENDETVEQADKLHKVANRTYALGIGKGINMEELHDIASDPLYVGDMSTFEDLETFVRNFVLVQKGCYTSKKQAHRAVKLQENVYYGHGLKKNTIKTFVKKPGNKICFELSYITAENFPDSVNESCSSFHSCPLHERSRQSICSHCSTEIADFHQSIIQPHVKNITDAAFERCFPAELAMAVVSRLSVHEGTLQNNGWRKCILGKYQSQRCYGLMHVPESFGPNTTVSGSSIEHFMDGIDKLTELISKMSSTFESFTPSEQTRAGLAAYDAGIMSIKSRERIDEATVNGDFSSDIMSRAKQFAIYLQ